MLKVNGNWIRLIGIVGCTMWMTSCKQAPDVQVKPSYSVMYVALADNEL